MRQILAHSADEVVFQTTKSFSEQDKTNKHAGLSFTHLTGRCLDVDVSDEHATRWHCSAGKAIPKALRAPAIGFAMQHYHSGHQHVGMAAAHLRDGVLDGEANDKNTACFSSYRRHIGLLVVWRKIATQALSEEGEGLRVTQYCSPAQVLLRLNLPGEIKPVQLAKSVSISQSSAIHGNFLSVLYVRAYVHRLPARWSLGWQSQ